MCGDVVSWGNCGSVGKTRPDLRRPGLVSEASGFGIRTQKPLPKGLAEGGALGERCLGPYAFRCPTARRIL